MTDDQSKPRAEWAVSAAREIARTWPYEEMDYTNPSVDRLAEMIQFAVQPALAELTEKLAGAEARGAGLREALCNYGAHQRGCTAGQWEKGEPYPNGYRTMYAGKWYYGEHQPPCECGLRAALDREGA